ncbi:hypothetical protein Zmor_010024 [Zophobas morio]|uniref:Uncharacterized protein n=1 Tax=Zophobas morio TaxID=2755281 RepID=A0AA38II17_9CUCU|nr:hypothetical protein Zmor_010024 [Zophobas morio]
MPSQPDSGENAESPQKKGQKAPSREQVAGAAGDIDSFVARRGGGRARAAAATCVTPHDPSRPLHSTEGGRTRTKAHSFGLMLRTRINRLFLCFIAGWDNGDGVT